jgi:hypothetical protein
MKRIAVAVALTWALLGQDPRQIALLIGNKDYAKKPLANPINDATDLAAALKAVGFDATLATNLNRADLDRSVRMFAARLQPRRYGAVLLLGTRYGSGGAELPGCPLSGAAREPGVGCVPQ